MSDARARDAVGRDAINGPLAVSLSIVSHGHGRMVAQLLSDIRALRWPGSQYEIILTCNTPEDTGFLQQFSDLPLHVILNRQPVGFGANHNAAFHRSQGLRFAVVNPDIRLPALDLSAWTAPLESPPIACCAPLARNSQGELQDNARRFPTLFSLMKRVVTGKRIPDYDVNRSQQAIDWAAGYFLLYKREAYAQVGGFDERYHMYMEDVDMAARLHQHGWQVVWDTSVEVIHDAQRASHRHWRHVMWHVRSVVRFLWGRSIGGHGRIRPHSPHSSSPDPTRH